IYEHKNDIKKPYIDNLYENDFLFVSVEKISKSKDKRYISLSLNIVNTTTENIFLAFSDRQPTIAGDNGTVESTGNVYGLPMLRFRNIEDSSTLSKLYAGKKTNVNLKYFGDFKDVSEVSYSSEMILYNESASIKFSVGIANIKI
ncbi:MAG: hypothetical protein MI863_11145, partial [Desulfobacterales bacterium]|nr:hypothetical protein [Desulfobacterales bacterium]